MAGENGMMMGFVTAATIEGTIKVYSGIFVMFYVLEYNILLYRLMASRSLFCWPK